MNKQILNKQEGKQIKFGYLILVYFTFLVSDYEKKKKPYKKAHKKKRNILEFCGKTKEQVWHLVHQWQVIKKTIKILSLE